ncbi:MAG: 5,10-methylenetetrahydromethanopterin reductase [Actinomycetota bacterium]|jgi:alkanesulfonate monooxygenase SsuD/methylene tetrahydromethanopterin reductase-like flavin-dependent oxidoreductase (luciferase family)|nr:5,10-methylenetetrahydromethanopterin reductase [Actinomycetota bacterium]
MDNDRVGFAAGYDPAADVKEMAEWFKRADEAGFEIGFFSETIELMRDSVSALTAFALSTKRMQIGCTQIVRLRTPLVMAQTFASLDEIADGRLMVAPGACTNTHAKRHGLESINPGATLRDWIQSIRAILAGGEVDYDGETVKFSNVKLGFEPRRRYIPMYIPATSTTGLKIAGTIGDGVLLNAICSPEYSANALKIVRKAVDDSGRDWADFKVAQLINCSVEDDHQKAVDAIKWEVASKLDPIQLPFIAGPKMRVGEPYIKKEDIPKFEEAWARGGKEELIKAVPDSYVEGMTASGTPEEVQKRVQEFRDVGVQLPILRPAAKHQATRLMDLFAPN